MHSIKNLPRKDYENYSPNQMHYILHNPYSKESCITLLRPSEKVCKQIPLYNMVVYLLNILNEQGEIKLTATKRLPPKIVEEIYKQQYMLDRGIEGGLVNTFREAEVYPIHLARIIAELSPFTKIRLGKMSITQKGKKALLDHDDLFSTIYDIYTSKFLWGYFDGYEDDALGQFGYNFSLILFDKYGNDYIDIKFYAKKYFKAFPLDEIIDTFRSHENAYSCRTLRFLECFGLVTITDDHFNQQIKKAPLFSSIFNVKKPM